MHLLAQSLGPVPVPGTVLTNTILVGCVALLHIQVATYLTGSSTIVAVSEGISMSNGDERHERLARSLVHSWGYVFSFGTAVAAFFVLFALAGVWGRFFVVFQQFTFWVWFFEALTFVGEIALLYTLYANWDRLRSYRLARLGLVILLNVDQWWQMFFVDVVASQMLTPSVQGAQVNTSYLIQFLNPTNLPLTIHRTFGNIAWAGAVVAFASGFQYLRATRHQEARALVPGRTSFGAGAGGDARGGAGPGARPRGGALGLGRPVGPHLRARVHHPADLGGLQLRQGGPAPRPGQLVPDDVRLDLQHLPGPVLRARVDLHPRGWVLLAAPPGGRAVGHRPPPSDRPHPARAHRALRGAAGLVGGVLSRHRRRSPRQAVLAGRAGGSPRLLLPLEGGSAWCGDADRALRPDLLSPGRGSAPR